ncbi:hypothetical protein M441DRAFT_86485 [Trichoderma asperellum CBS 433.97]|uniref:Uncharacterized protein n=1 Tax=Trichoderma asperellum (strain ATCC 204424 / CBS 433.97 / NBRC 101777) TaxID=1042311 RepID=A0A2T3ZKI8_TRIA4|nr:hypothetical protein M441DRAFT_86485 [Trichoderma asperellum CBS 433.97]PTB45316.1 hypothetical protein M441DRAFT_86485 [Trichoderma asperellum CBS 433.97]
MASPAVRRNQSIGHENLDGWDTERPVAVAALLCKKDNGAGKRHGTSVVLAGPSQKFHTVGWRSGAQKHTHTHTQKRRAVSSKQFNHTVAAEKTRQKWLSQKALSRTRLRGELKEIKSLRIAAIPIVRASCSPNKNKINVRPEIGFTFGTLG